MRAFNHMERSELGGYSIERDPALIWAGFRYSNPREARADAKRTVEA